ncbi:MAG: chorismate synthase [Clostridia bacterium]|nr:chorismate synthase [Clostridia bacterium]MBQ9774372.1 chorismate synthase [Clostridia bacterium]
MKNTFGHSVSVTLFGESHGSEIGAVLDGLTPGLTVDEDFIRHQLSLRRPQGKISTPRVEADEFRIVSGVFEGKTTGTPLCILIPNTNTRSKDYTKGLPRPGHADYTAECKYHGFQDYRGGGHFSGRITAALVAAGAIAISALRQNGILIGTHISRLSDVYDRPFEHYEADLEMLGDLAFPVLDSHLAQDMRERIEDAARDGDSVGGVLETAVIGLPAGVGEPWFDSLEGVLAHALFSIPGIKGVEFGDGFALAGMRGSLANDGFRVAKDGKIVTTTNHNGGINGGITNGMPVIFRCAVKPTPSVFCEQESVDLQTKQNALLTLEGRHDPAIIHRARIVVDSITALALCDQLALRYGTDFNQ